MNVYVPVTLAPPPPADATQAVAECWASIDGKLDDFRACRDDPEREAVEGRHGGYTAEAEAMILRLRARGFLVVRAP